MGGSGTCRVGYGPVCDTSAGCGGRAGGLAMGMTRQYVAGELSVLLAQLQAVTTSEAARRDAWSLRYAAETEPIPALGSVTVRALALTEGLCWDSLNRGDTAASPARRPSAPSCTSSASAPTCSRRLRQACPRFSDSYLPARGQDNGRKPGAAGF